MPYNLFFAKCGHLGPVKFWAFWPNLAIFFKIKIYGVLYPFDHYESFTFLSYFFKTNFLKKKLTFYLDFEKRSRFWFLGESGSFLKIEI